MVTSAVCHLDFASIDSNRFKDYHQHFVFFVGRMSAVFLSATWMCKQVADHAVVVRLQDPSPRYWHGSKYESKQTAHSQANRGSALRWPTSATAIIK